MRGLKCHKGRIKSYAAVMSECRGLREAQHHSDTWRQTLNSDLVRSGEGGADPPGARWCIEHSVLTLGCSLERERAGCFPLRTG